LTNSEGNHGAGCEGIYFNRDSTRRTSYMKYLYKLYPGRISIADLSATNCRRLRQGIRKQRLERMSLRSGLGLSCLCFWSVFFFFLDVSSTYAKASQEAILIEITALQPRHRNPRRSIGCPRLVSEHLVLETGESARPASPEGTSNGSPLPPRVSAIVYFRRRCRGADLHERDPTPNGLFGTPNRTPYVTDGIDRHTSSRRREAVNPDRNGDEMAAHYRSPSGRREADTPLRVFPRRGLGLPLRTAASTQRSRPAAPRPTRSMLRSIPRRSMPTRHRECARPGRHAWPSSSNTMTSTGGSGARRGSVKGQPNGQPPRNEHWHHVLTNPRRSLFRCRTSGKYPLVAEWDLAFPVLTMTMGMGVGKQQPQHEMRETSEPSGRYRL